MNGDDVNNVRHEASKHLINKNVPIQNDVKEGKASMPPFSPRKGSLVLTSVKG
jgi:hypothetical protein